MGAVGAYDRASLQFLGDTGNMASRLQGLTKELNCTMIVSAATLTTAGWLNTGWRQAAVEVRGTDTVITAFLIDRPADLAAAWSRLGAS